MISVVLVAQQAKLSQNPRQRVASLQNLFCNKVSHVHESEGLYISQLIKVCIVINITIMNSCGFSKKLPHLNEDFSRMNVRFLAAQFCPINILSSKQRNRALRFY